MSRPVLCAVMCAASVWLSAAASAVPAIRFPAAAHDYRHTGYHRQVAALDQQIRLRKAEISALERQLAAWQPLNRFRDGGPLMVTIDNTKLLLMQAEIDLACLEQELFDVVRLRGYQ